MKSNGVKIEPVGVKLEPEVKKEPIKFPQEHTINHTEETVIKSWEAIQAVKTLASPLVSIRHITGG